LTGGAAAITAGQDALDRGAFAEALAIFVNETRRAPNSVDAWFGCAAANYGIGDFHHALAAAERCVQLAPNDQRGFYVLAPPAFALNDAQGIDICRTFMGRLTPGAGESLARFWSERLSEKELFSAAADAFEIYAAYHPEDEKAAPELANLYINASEIDKAEAVIDRCEKRIGKHGAFQFIRARIAIMRGDIDAAKRSALHAIDNNDRPAPAYFILSDIAPELIDANKAARLEKILGDEGLHPDLKIGGLFALGRTHHSRDELDQAFNCFAAAKSLSKEFATAAGIIYDRQVAEASAQRIAARYPAASPTNLQDSGAPRKIFIIGMPRSGSTLVDQILSRHSLVASLGESTIMPTISNSIERRSRESGRPFRACTAEMREQFHAAYRQAAGSAPRIIDKNLFNFECCGLIADLDPNACFILTKREPADIALSIFKTKFLAAHPWSNELRDIAHKQASFEFLVSHWRKMLGERIHIVNHEELVANFEPGVRALLEFCGLDFEEQCLDFHKGDRQVFTTSAAQVRRPINADGVGRWKRYEKHLAPYFESLEEFRRRYALI